MILFTPALRFMGNIHSTPIHRPIPESIPIDESEIQQNAKELFNDLRRRSRSMDLTKDPWYSTYKHVAEQKWTWAKVGRMLPGLGTAMGIFTVYCLLEQAGLYDDGGWQAWAHDKEDH